MTLIRTGFGARKFMRDLARRGTTTIPPDGITVRGHCVGAVARAFTGRAAGYDDAHAMLDAVRAAGKLRTGTPPVDAVVFWRGGKHGHVAIQTIAGFIWTVDLPTPGKVGWVKRAVVAQRWGYVEAGWCYAGDIPGWR